MGARACTPGICGGIDGVEQVPYAPVDLGGYLVAHLYEQGLIAAKSECGFSEEWHSLAFGLGSGLAEGPHRHDLYARFFESAPDGGSQLHGAGMSPWRHMVSACMGISSPVIAVTEPSVIILRLRSTTSEGSCSTEPSIERATRVPSALNALSANVSRGLCYPSPWLY